MKIGVLTTGDTAVRAAHSLAAHPGVDRVVVIGPARSNSFPVQTSAKGCDILIASGPGAPEMARKHGLPMVWDGQSPSSEGGVWGASPQGLTISLMSEDRDHTLVAVAYPEAETEGEQRVRFPEPLGSLPTADIEFAGHLLATGRATNGFSACLVSSPTRRLAIVDDARFLAGVSLAAGIAGIFDGFSGPVWEHSNPYLRTATDMGLVMAESTA